MADGNGFLDGENHGKTMGKPWENDVLMDYEWIMNPPAMTIYNSLRT